MLAFEPPNVIQPLLFQIFFRKSLKEWHDIILENKITSLDMYCNFKSQI